MSQQWGDEANESEFQLIIHNVEINIFCVSTKCNAECKACFWSIWLRQMVCVVSMSLASGHVCVPCFNGQEAGKGHHLFCLKYQGAMVKNKSEESHFQSLTANHFSALPGSFLSLLQTPERRMSLLGFHVCFLILHWFYNSCTTETDILPFVHMVMRWSHIC